MPGQPPLPTAPVVVEPPALLLLLLLIELAPSVDAARKNAPKSEYTDSAPLLALLEEDEPAVLERLCRRCSCSAARFCSRTSSAEVIAGADGLRWAFAAAAAAAATAAAAARPVKTTSSSSSSSSSSAAAASAALAVPADAASMVTVPSATLLSSSGWQASCFSVVIAASGEVVRLSTAATSADSRKRRYRCSCSGDRRVHSTTSFFSDSIGDACLGGAAAPLSPATSPSASTAAAAASSPSDPELPAAAPAPDPDAEAPVPNTVAFSRRRM